MTCLLNLFIPKGAPGYDQMVAAAEAGRLGTFAADLAHKWGRRIDSSEYIFYDAARGGVYVNLKDYLEICGKRRG